MLKKFLTISLLLSFVATLMPILPIPIAKAAVTPPAFSLYPSSGSYYHACENIDVDILIHTNNTDTDSANIIIGYDDTKVTVQDDNPSLEGIQITPGTAYDNHASYTVNETTKNILLTGYNIGTPFNSGGSYATFGSFTLNPTAAGSTNLTIDFTPSETIDSNIAEAITSNDILNAVENATFTLLDDNNTPYTTDLNPTGSATNVAVNSNVVFRLKDNECGVDIDQLQVTVDGTTYRKSVSPTFSYSGTPGNYLITINPATNFGYDETINVDISAKDTQNNTLTQSYSFTTIADTTAPTVSNRNPASGATNILKSSNVQFRISDTETGVDIDTVSANVNGTIYTKAGPNTFSYTGSAAAYDITINPAVDFPTGSTVNVSIDADDLANTPNSMSTNNYSFSLDATPPTISNRNPAADATNILKATNVYFTVSDAAANVDLSSISATVDGVTYTQSGPNTFSYTGGGSSYNITINPTSDFSTGATISVSIDASDTEGNAMSTLEYSFSLDATPPAISDLSPINSASDVAKNTNITFTVADATANVNLSTVSATVGGITYTAAGPNTFSYTGGGSSYNITINPDSDFSRGDTVNISIAASDSEGNAMTTYNSSFSVIANSVPVITTIPDKIITAGNLLTFLVEATDTDGDTITLVMSDDLPAGAQFTSISNERGIFTWTPTEADVAIHTVDFTATDDGPGSGSYVETVQITVNTAGGDNTAPSLTNLGDQTVYQGSVMNFLIHSTDAQNDSITLQASTTNQSALTLVNLSNGLASLTVDSSKLSVGTNTITITATDNGSPTAASQLNFTITVTALPTCPTCEVCTTCEVCEEAEPTTCPTCEVCEEAEPTTCPESTTTIIYGGGGGGSGGTGTLSNSNNDEPAYFWGHPAANEEESIPEEEELSCPEPEEVIRYITIMQESDEASEDNINDPMTIIYNSPGTDKQSLLEPVIIVLGDDEGLIESAFSLIINGKNVSFKQEHRNTKSGHLYTITYIPTEMYNPNTIIPVQLKYLETGKDAVESFSFTFKTGDEIPIFLTPAEKEEEPVNIEITNLFLEQVTPTQMKITGTALNAEEIEITWYSKDDTATVIKKIKANKFDVRSPLEFETGTYRVEIIARTLSGQTSTPMSVEFSISQNEITVHETTENSLYGSAEDSWHVFWRWILALLNTLFGMHLVGDTFPKGV